MNRSSKYGVMKQEYVTGDDSVTYKALGQKYGRAVGSIGRIAKMENWPLLREQFRAENDGRVRELVVERQAERIVELHDSFLSAAQSSIDRYRAAVESGQIVPNPGDVARLVMTVKELLSIRGAVESPEAAGDGIHISAGVSREFIRALEAAARGRANPGAVERPAPAQLVSSGAR